VKRLKTRVASFDRSVQLLMVNQFAINLGFYMLLPYLADHLSHGLGLAAWTVGLVLGVRNLSQQGMFLIGGTLADRYGCKPMILTGCLLRTVAFVCLAIGVILLTAGIIGLVTGRRGTPVTAGPAGYPDVPPPGQTPGQRPPPSGGQTPAERSYPPLATEPDVDPTPTEPFPRNPHDPPTEASDPEFNRPGG